MPPNSPIVLKYYEASRGGILCQEIEGYGSILTPRYQRLTIRRLFYMDNGIEERLL